MVLAGRSCGSSLVAACGGVALFGDWLAFLFAAALRFSSVCTIWLKVAASIPLVCSFMVFFPVLIGNSWSSVGRLFGGPGPGVRPALCGLLMVNIPTEARTW